jgi:hypothetical protein
VVGGLQLQFGSLPPLLSGWCCSVGFYSALMALALNWQVAILVFSSCRAGGYFFLVLTLLSNYKIECSHKTTTSCQITTKNSDITTNSVCVFGIPEMNPGIFVSNKIKGDSTYVNYYYDWQ